MPASFAEAPQAGHSQESTWYEAAKDNDTPADWGVTENICPIELRDALIKSVLKYSQNQSEMQQWTASRSNRNTHNICKMKCAGTKYM
jgi:hypothetical protein